MNDSERLAALRTYVTERLAHLDRLLTYHRGRVEDPGDDHFHDENSYFDYVMALGEQKALLALLPGFDAVNGGHHD